MAVLHTHIYDRGYRSMKKVISYIYGMVCLIIFVLRRFSAASAATIYPVKTKAFLTALRRHMVSAFAGALTEERPKRKLSDHYLLRDRTDL